ncbi:hypothetical protein [Buttiauxella massiliensis]|uniref:hypothetical protein n=1 Tax=Buttiauxella massiliensis TaxID=2831590 RepID=UPI001869B095|nr:hypothetical protein [Buttiauxella massiliensis]
MTPDSYRKWLTTLSHSGVKVWVQDGAGTQMLTDAERALYLKAPSAGKVIDARSSRPGQNLLLVALYGSGQRCVSHLKINVG